MMESLSIILPAYNEEQRLPRTFSLLQQAKREGVFEGVELTEILLVDDGSKDHTSEVAKKYQSEFPQLKVIQVVPNQGKGNAIHVGLIAATTQWCLIADADTATPWNQFKKLFAAVSTGDRKTKIAIGSRDLPESEVRVQQSWVREHMGKTFNLIVRTITGLPYRDTQCGFKLIHRPSIQSFLGQLQVKRFSWDVEFLMFARAFDLTIKEVAVAWEHQDSSRVHPIRDSLEMLLRVLQLRVRIWFLPKRK